MQHMNLHAIYVKKEKRGSVYLRNSETNDEVSPLRMKCPDGPSPRNSENHDSCSISSLRIALDS